MRPVRRAWKRAAALLSRRADSEMRGLAVELTRALKKRLDAPVDVRELAEALCQEMSRRRDDRPVQLRFERFPDEIEVTGLWMEFHDFDLVIVEERAETVQQLVILGHELWHMMAGHSHSHHHYAGAAAAAGALSDDPGWQEIALTVAARNGSHEADEAEAEDFGLHLASVFRTWVTGPRTKGPADPVDPVGQAIQASLGYRGPQD
ncbi:MULTISPECIES: toxin-antitoxin system, toxin component [Streptomyces]|uniref:Toxin-antitoxin system, toxin component n=1 Tax=Streptomyces mirabilis TaxID=68239 RepID=A0ABU3UUG8_9ACTN|nr:MULTISPECIES: toxin-antitoxin system, toxin component [Streptomyces]MCX4608549.1 toxin-antitoxin system, toxin component [Streptomyces mirabilis]MCX5349033.1 toxin-antitoxin system, toxin component [Streptomyces mirabilis]MDU8997574.1 toxin-antitoxin system, toxin component [Streptomyces mirabilis]QDN93977.1 toxin-antitoxin system, toxin component [Streptomyces sp. RLB3-6]QDO14386.1 toxin-antitoxin system, toxin component [Streptomyces sp. S1D4-23]